ncbi:hypothetical protein P3S67_021970 [Capsicum chacoense]
MRIRKRFPPPPLDPKVNNQVLVQLNINNDSLPSDLPNQSHPQPSDQPVTVTGGKPSTSWVAFGGNSNNQDKLNKKKDVEAEEEEKLWREKKESFGSTSNDNDNKKESFLTNTSQLGSLLPQSSSSSDLDGRWCEEDDHKVIPLKKRSRDSYHNINNNSSSNINTMKSKTNKKCPPENGNEEKQEQGHYRRIDNTNTDHKVGQVNKKSKRGSVILEGSRCSRVNGRGWRCCQQTLVGYSLCEHHLGKGRLRSMNSTVQNSMNNKKKKEEVLKEEKSLPNDHEYYGVDDNDDDDDDKKDSFMTKKKKMKKLGMVKARSLSSLLGQTDNAVATMVVVDNDNKKE